MSSGILRDAFRAFTTGCAFITTEGPNGPNVMAAEWTFNVSYHPFLILVSVDPANMTHNLIRESKEFGVNLVAEDQVAAMAFAGHFSKADTDKLSSELFETVPAKRIRVPMIRGSLLAAECRLVEEIPLGDHTGFLGEVVEFTLNQDARPLVLHHGSRHLGERIQRAPGIALAVTPMRAHAGGDIHIRGQLTAADRGEVEVVAAIRGPAGVLMPAGQVRSVSDGEFRMTANLPLDLAPGIYTVSARVEKAEGRARFEVIGSPALRP